MWGKRATRSEKGGQAEPRHGQAREKAPSSHRTKARRVCGEAEGGPMASRLVRPHPSQPQTNPSSKAKWGNSRVASSLKQGLQVDSAPVQYIQFKGRTGSRFQALARTRNLQCHLRVQSLGIMQDQSSRLPNPIVSEAGASTPEAVAAHSLQEKASEETMQRTKNGSVP